MPAGSHDREVAADHQHAGGVEQNEEVFTVAVGDYFNEISRDFRQR
jgi:hypothetical protein